MSFYDEFADCFSKKRRNPWNAFEEFIKSLETEKVFQNCRFHGIWCDLGAGNGRHLPILTRYTRKYIGTDLSFQLLEIARSEIDIYRQYDWVACDVNRLPFRNNTFSSIISVAVFHHILSKHDLRRVLDKISKLLKKKGVFVLTLWGVHGGKNQNRIRRKNFHRRFSSQKIFDGCTPSEQFELGINDVLIPWVKTNKGGTSIKKPRIYHLYTYNELNIYDESFEIVTKDIKNLGINAGNNYFLCLQKK